MCKNLPKIRYLHIKNTKKQAQTRKIPRTSIRISHGRSQLSHDSNIIYIIMHKILPPKSDFTCVCTQNFNYAAVWTCLSCPFLPLVCGIIRYVFYEWSL